MKAKNKKQVNKSTLKLMYEFQRAMRAIQPRPAAEGVHVRIGVLGICILIIYLVLK